MEYSILVHGRRDRKEQCRLLWLGLECICWTEFLRPNCFDEMQYINGLFFFKARLLFHSFSASFEIRIFHYCLLPSFCSTFFYVFFGLRQFYFISYDSKYDALRWSRSSQWAHKLVNVRKRLHGFCDASSWPSNHAFIVDEHVFVGNRYYNE